MPVEYLAYLNFILLTRLVYLIKDQRLTGPGNLILTAIQCAICASSFQWNSTLLVMLICVIVFTGLGWFVEGRVKNIAIWRLLSLACLIFIPGIYFSGNEGHAFSSFYDNLGSVILTNAPLFRVEVLDGRIGILIFGCLLVANETNIAMSVILHCCNLEPHKEKTSTGEQGSIDHEEFRAGRIIGVLERWLILPIVVYSDNLSVLGFIVAAKGLVRFSKFKDDARFAEYVLVGTLLSVLAAVIVAKWISVLPVI